MNVSQDSSDGTVTISARKMLPAVVMASARTKENVSVKTTM